MTESEATYFLKRHNIEYTPAQALAFARVCNRQLGSGNDFVQVYKELCGSAIMVQFKHITIGIEPDGYAHS